MKDWDNDGDELEDSGDLESDQDSQDTCSYCNGTGMVLSRNGDDEEDRDFEDCPECNGTGILNGEEDSRDNEHSTDFE